MSAIGWFFAILFAWLYYNECQDNEKLEKRIRNEGANAERLASENDGLRADASIWQARGRWDHLLAEVRNWQRTTFPHATAESTYKHFLEEVAELGDDLTSRGELADCLLLLFGVADVQGIDPYEAVSEKLAINVMREWGAPDADGVSRHIAGREGGSLGCARDDKPTDGGEWRDDQQLEAAELDRRWEEHVKGSAQDPEFGWPGMIPGRDGRATDGGSEG